MKVKVKVIPRAKKERIEESDKVLRIYTVTPPIKGRANKRVIEILAKHFNVKKHNIKIIKGETAREKVFQIDGVD